MKDYINVVEECEAPKLPNGAKVGTYLNENGILVWRRRIKPKHVLRLLDALTVNAYILEQLRQDGVLSIRYCLVGWGVYETSLASFLEKSAFLPGFAGGEDVHALPREQWDFQPTGTGLGLFESVGQPA